MALPTLDTDHLRTLVAIAESGSFTRAADEVNKTQAAVSMQMRRLEESVGRRLFNKAGRTNRLTPEGEHLLEYARRIISLNNEALSILTEPELSGFVRIGTPDDYAERFLPQIFARFARTHPLVEVEISCQGSTSLFQEIQQGNLDLAIVTHMDADSRGEVIRREQLFWVTSPRHRTEDA
ncbi:MAG: LysR family transcriptional regulator, partial [Pseudomonadota bacterium]|nr:LysR family transcriptional regulator [Pseudomonadota bacterium]